MPGRGLSDRLAGAVVLRNQAASNEIAVDTRGEARLMLTDQILRRGGSCGEFRRIEMPTTSNAMDVRSLLVPATAAWRQIFAFAFGEALFSLHRGGT